MVDNRRPCHSSMSSAGSARRAKLTIRVNNLNLISHDALHSCCLGLERGRFLFIRGVWVWGGEEMVAVVSEHICLLVFVCIHRAWVHHPRRVLYERSFCPDSRGTNIKTFNSYVDAWEGTAALMSAFTTSVPYSVNFESNASTSLSMDKQETHYDSKKEFGDSGSDLTAGFTSVKFVSGAQSYSADQASEINLSILSKGTDTISGPFSIPQTKLSTWTCNDKADAARGEVRRW